ncbi:MAG: hypothetical protein CM15mP51_09420 [Porticoccaceae bacterium]|nr:MAG: hypothetical protein CM15mP51_09420 [Porticoccaceae bacterium]
MILSIIFLINGVICGIILLQTLVVAPSVFKSLGELHAGPFLRSLFPKFFIVLSVLGLIGAILSILNGINLTFFIAISSMLLSVSAYLLIPATNRAKDKNDKKHFLGCMV